MAETDNDLNTPAIAVAGVVGAVVVFAIVVGLQAWFYNAQNSLLEERVVGRPNAALVQALAEQQGRINSYRVIDAEKKTVAIPIRRAMDLVVRERNEPSALSPTTQP